MVLTFFYRLFFLFLLIFISSPLTPLRAQGLEPTVSILPQPLDVGSPARVVISNFPLDVVISGRFDDKPIFFFPHNSSLIGLFGADIALAQGTYPLTLFWEGGKKSFEVVVKAKDYGVRDIKVPQSKVELSPEDLARSKKESDLTKAALAIKSPEKLWSGEFIEPVNSRVNSSFGRLTRLNGKLNSRPHAGADYLAPTGTPVKAPADGLVLLTGDHFFAGKSVYLDHGQGLISMYFHLSEIKVEEGLKIKKGQILGLTGQSGRVTGAHLHYGIYINGARIDPLVFRRLTSQLTASPPKPTSASKGL
ncbi:MAG: M23 family metallopeptidase [Deltaproteobacteria bacterium]|jgi:hypothetical protein|nr:M23 family metallopeptidase [Deltaproteobacteria bacterium]